MVIPGGQHYSLFSYNGFDGSFIVAERGGAIFNTGAIATALDQFGNPQPIKDANGNDVVQFGALSIKNTRFENNQASAFGGAIYNTKTGRFEIINSEFALNASSQGGAIWNEGIGIIRDSLFDQSNLAGTGIVGGRGGAIYNIATNVPAHIPGSGNLAFAHPDKTWEGYTINFVNTPGSEMIVTLTDRENKIVTVSYDSANTSHTYTIMLNALNGNNWVDVDGNEFNANGLRIKPAGLAANLVWDHAAAQGNPLRPN
jgi:predicted outer membrane repeat protein